MRFSDGRPEQSIFFTSKTAVRFDMPLTFPDYHGRGGPRARRAAARCDAAFDGRELGCASQNLGSRCPNSRVPA